MTAHCEENGNFIQIIIFSCLFNVQVGNIQKVNEEHFVTTGLANLFLT